MRYFIVLLLLAGSIHAQIIGSARRRLLTSTPVGGPTYVKSAVARDVAASVGAAFGSAPAAGNLIHVTAWWLGTSTLTSITDNCGTSGGGTNTYTIDSTVPYSTVATAVQGWALVGYGKACTVTVTISGSAWMTVLATEINGVSATTPIATAQHSIAISNHVGTGTDAVKSASITTTQDKCLILSVGINPGWSALARGTGYSVGTQNSVPDTWSEYLTQSAAGAIQSSWTAAGDGVYMIQVTAIQGP